VSRFRSVRPAVGGRAWLDFEFGRLRRPPLLLARWWRARSPCAAAAPRGCDSGGERSFVCVCVPCISLLKGLDG
jgi:hypothetical protein